MQFSKLWFEDFYSWNDVYNYNVDANLNLNKHYYNINT